MARTYDAIVCGTMREDSGTVDAPIGRHPTDRKKMCVTERNSKPAVTHWEVVKRYRGYTHIRCHLETGRTHQIRVHMAYIGHPILGDMVYGHKKPELGQSSQCLHAGALCFRHPRDGRPVSDILQTVYKDPPLTAPDSTVPARNLEAIGYFMENGGAFTVNTGRSVPMSRAFLDKVPANVPLLLYNGSAAYDRETGMLSQLHPIGLDLWQTVEKLLNWFPDLVVEVQGVNAHTRVTTNARTGPARQADPPPPCPRRPRPQRHPHAGRGGLCLLSRRRRRSRQVSKCLQVRGRGGGGCDLRKNPGDSEIKLDKPGDSC